MRDWLRFLVYVFYCIEGGLFLAIVPWRPLWEQSYFFARWPQLAQVLGHPVGRGVVSGIGVALLLHGANEIVSAVLRPAGRGDRTAAPSALSPAPPPPATSADPK